MGGKNQTTFKAKAEAKEGDRVPRGRPKGAVGKATANARNALALFIEGNTDRLQSWLDEVHERDGPRAAFQCFSDLIEYHVPKLSRTEVTGADEGPVELVITWSNEK